MTTPKNKPQLFHNNRGVLSLDEGLDRLKDRFLAARFTLSGSTQREYLSLMIDAPDLNTYISAITLSDQGARLLDSEAELFAKHVIKQGFVLGIRADLGYERSSLFRRQVVTRGITGLDVRLSQYKKWGASYVVWRNKYYITTSTPTQTIIELNNQEALDFVINALKHKLTPVVQIKISTNGNQTMKATYEVMSIILEDLFTRMEIMEIDPADIILQTNFVTPGRHAKQSESPTNVGKITSKLFEDVVPKSIGGIILVGDGLRPGFGRLYLQAFQEAYKKSKHKAPFSFSFGRGLHDSAMQAWAGKDIRKTEAQIILVQNSRLDWQANV